MSKFRYRRIFRSGDFSFITNQDYTGDVQIVLPADRVEAEDTIVTVKIPLSVVKAFVYRHIRNIIRNATTEETEQILMEVWEKND